MDHSMRDQLRRTMRGSVMLPGDDGYEASIKRWSAACEKRAAIVAQPINSADASACVRFAVAHDIPLTVCGGGHSSSGASSSAGGLVLDLCKMRHVEVNVDKLTVTFEGGCVWEDVDRVLEKHSLATVGGVVNHTGVGGLILGGGHGWLTPLHGLSIDNLIAAEVVLADGSLVTADDSQNADLFWAIRGAGAQFGVVTRFVSQAHKQGLVWSGSLAYAADKLPALIAVANQLRFKSSTGHCLALGVGYGPDETSHVIVANPCFHGSEADGKHFFSSLLAIENLADSTRMMSVAQMNTLLNPLLGHGIRRLMGSANVVTPLDAHGICESAQRFWDFCDARPDMGKSIIAIEFFPTEKICEVAQTATAYANRGNYYDAMTIFGWCDEAIDAEVRQFNRDICEQIRSSNGYQALTSSDEANQPVGKYINIESDFVAPRDAFGVNLPRLRELKRKYDPGNVFHKWHGVDVKEGSG